MLILISFFAFLNFATGIIETNETTGMAIKAIRLYLYNDLYGNLYTYAMFKSSPGIFGPRLSASIKGFVVVDKDCGKRLPDCKKYCNELLFSKMYCPPVCKPYSAQTLKIYCGDEFNQYNHSSDNILTEMGEWKAFLGPTLSEGIYVKDRLTLFTNGATPVKMNNFTFASGLLVDRQFFKYAFSGDSMLGLAPSSSSSIPELNPFPIELHQRKLIQDSVLTLARNNDSLFLGGFDGDSCNLHTYRSTKTIEEGKWKLRLEEMLVPHLDMKVMNPTVTFEPHFTGIGIPQIYVQRLLDSGKIGYRNGKYFRQCNDTFEFKFYLQKQEYSFNWKTFDYDECYLFGFIPLDTPYTNTNQWIFGAKVIENVCVVLNYEKDTIGFAKFLYNKLF